MVRDSSIKIINSCKGNSIKVNTFHVNDQSLRLFFTVFSHLKSHTAINLFLEHIPPLHLKYNLEDMRSFYNVDYLKLSLLNKALVNFI